MRRPNLPAVAIAALVLAAAGCMKEKTTIAVYPDGSGKITLHTTVLKAIARLTLMAAQNDEDRKRLAEQNIYKELASYDGICAWTDVTAAVTSAGEIDGAAVGYFEDVTQLRQTSESQSSRSLWTKTEDGGWVYELVADDPAKDTTGTDRMDKFFKRTPQKQIDRTLDQATKMLDGFLAEHQVVMPGEVTAIEGAQTKEGRTATYRLDDKALGALVKTAYAKGQELRAKIDAGTATEDQAREELRSLFKSVRGGLKVVCKAGQVDDEARANHAALDAAKKTYPGSETEARVSRARGSGLRPGTSKPPKKTGDDDGE
jgi:hypothetical protein